MSREVRLLLQKYERTLEDLLVVYDELAFPWGQMRLLPKGSAGGHNGLASVIQQLQTNEVPRIRIGVGAARPGKMIGHVLSRFPADEAEVMEEAYVRASDAAECAVREGFETAMNRFNIRTEPRPTVQTTQDKESREPEIPS